MECSAAVMLGRPLSLHFQEIDVEVKLYYPGAAVLRLIGHSFLKTLKNLIFLYQVTLISLHPSPLRRQV